MNFSKLNFSKLAGVCNYVVLGDNGDILPKIQDESFQLVYIDPPFNTGKLQQRRLLKTDCSPEGDRVGFSGRTYTTKEESSMCYKDSFNCYVEFIAPRIAQAQRLLSLDGTLYFHIDYREAHYCKILLDEIFGRECFLNEIIWAYDYGAKPKRRWPAKHDTILVYVKDPKHYYFDQNAIDRIPYMAPGLVTPEKANRGKVPTDVWWHTIVGTNSAEKTGYPTQKPEGILRRIIQASSAPDGWVLDFFAGSGTTGVVAQQLNRHFVLIDNNVQAFEIIKRRLGNDNIRYCSGTQNFVFDSSANYER
ncbi:MAG: site-specific DNA-methyltransferase [Actinobacteria bacterium]|nr:site-specific DNA-methyltransferase [Actinomycetota bacterium]MCL6104261.1 site-specific DNA-methyltransferase [Actinomycetota bacterium]